MVRASAASYLWEKKKKKVEELGNKTVAAITKHSESGSHQDKEAVKSKKAYLKPVVNLSERNKKNDKVKYRLRAKQFSFPLGEQSYFTESIVTGSALGEEGSSLHERIIG